MLDTKMNGPVHLTKCNEEWGKFQDHFRAIDTFRGQVPQVVRKLDDITKQLRTQNLIIIVLAFTMGLLLVIKELRENGASLDFGAAGLKIYNNDNKR